MRTFLSRVHYLPVLAILLVGLFACSSGDTGRLSLSLTDKPNNDVKAVFVTIKEIAVHAESDLEGSWTTVLTVNKTFNLTELGGGVRENLGIVNLDPGHYTQMRLLIGTDAISPHPFANYVVGQDDVPHELKVPSGVQTGIKLVQGFDINENSTTELTFDFDAARSVVVAGNSDKFILKPTIHAIDDSQVRTVIKGTVKTEGGDPIAGAEVSLQTFDNAAADARDKVVVVRSMTTDATGAYGIFFSVPQMTTFNIVATDWPSTDPNYGFDWDQAPDAVDGQSFTRDLVLPVVAEDGTLALKAIVADSDTTKNTEPETVVTISIRKVSDLPGTPPPDVEVMEVNLVGYDDEHTLDEITAIEVKLPPGDYKVVASTEGRPSIETPITIATGSNPLSFSFPVPPAP